MNNQPTVIENAPAWAWWTLAAVVAAIVIIGIWLTWPKQPKEPTAQAAAVETRSCAAWERQYAAIDGDKFPRDTLRVGYGERWLIRLPANNRPTGWVRFAGTPYLSQPSAEVQVIFPDGFSFVDSPERVAPTSGRFLRRYLGEGCVLVRVG